MVDCFFIVEIFTEGYMFSISKLVRILTQIPIGKLGTKVIFGRMKTTMIAYLWSVTT